MFWPGLLGSAKFQVSGRKLGQNLSLTLTHIWFNKKTVNLVFILLDFSHDFIHIFICSAEFTVLPLLQITGKKIICSHNQKTADV